MINDISQELIDTTIDILEARRNPKLNPKIGPYSKLKEYVDDPSIFISFTTIDMIGINPNSKYNTPLGVYTYPLKEAWHDYEIDSIYNSRKTTRDNRESQMTGKVVSKSTYRLERSVIEDGFPFASKSPYIQVVKTKKPLTDLQRFDSRDLDETITQTRKIVEDANKGESEHFESMVDRIDTGRANPLVDTTGGIFWWFTMNCSSINTPVGQIISKKYKSRSSMRLWNYLLRELGHDGFIDKGDGIIHKAEPTQAVFLHPKAFRHISTIENAPEILSTKKEKLYYWMNDNEISDDARYKYHEENDSYTWESGTFISGVWKKGDWEDGLWLDGVWKRGIWADGIWKGGRFIAGFFKGGTWETGTFGNEEEVPEATNASFSRNAIWEDGIWLNGKFDAKKWLDGTWYNGKFGAKNNKVSIWKNGTWYKGKFADAIWENGTWHDGTFESAIWENGTWLFGKFSDGTWQKGIWENGVFRGIWENGTWKDGAFGSGGKNNYSIWNNGIWEGGIFVEGKFNDGTWKGGAWFIGEWDGGQWEGGSIYSKKFGPDIMGRSTDGILDAINNNSEIFALSGDLEAISKNTRAFVESIVNPSIFREIEEEVDTIEELEERVAP